MHRKKSILLPIWKIAMHWSSICFSAFIVIIPRPSHHASFAYLCWLQNLFYSNWWILATGIWCFNEMIIMDLIKDSLYLKFQSINHNHNGSQKNREFPCPFSMHYYLRIYGPMNPADFAFVSTQHWHFNQSVSQSVSGNPSQNHHTFERLLVHSSHAAHQQLLTSLHPCHAA